MPPPLNHRYLYKRTSISGTPDELLRRRIAINETLRKKHREQLITAKRFRHLSRQEEMEAIDIDVVEHDLDIEPYYRLTQEQTEALAQDLRSNNKTTRMIAIQSLGKFVVEPAEALIQYITQGDCMQILTNLLNGTDIEEQTQVVQTISNIAAGPYDLWTKSIVAVPFMIHLLESDNPILKELAAHTIGNIACEELGNMETEVDEVRARIRDNGAIPPLARMLDSNASHQPSARLLDVKTIQSACFALANLAQGKESELRVFSDANIDQRLLHRLNREMADTVVDVAWVINCLAASSSAFQEKVVNGGFLSPMLKLVDALKDQDALVLPFVRTFGSLAHGSDDHVEILLQQPQFLPELMGLLRSDTSQRSFVTENVISPQLTTLLTDLLQNGHFDSREMAARCLLNIMHHGQNYMDAMDHRVILKGILHFLKSQDAGLIRLGLGYIDLLLNHVSNGKEVMDTTPDVMDALASVTPAPDPELFEVANKLVDKYYDEQGVNMQE
ncbi:ARM repeat-containing protein [Hesseltinella vesiculosa]|uniref:ARM repeat-containing protein n=1 Tax=Hesseltinella vesiculosa TaxID=101127 RepID=A0A1X2GBG5_9FUNG|nr:ARM repeat-containing protein [Hesseltinella vesiculosa]